MATLTVRLEVDPATKKKNVVIKYDSDSDALPQEHEEQHRRLVEQLVAGGALKPGDLGSIRVEREGDSAAVKADGEPGPAAPEAVPQKG